MCIQYSTCKSDRQKALDIGGEVWVLIDQNIKITHLKCRAGSVYSIFILFCEHFPDLGEVCSRVVSENGRKDQHSVWNVCSKHALLAHWKNCFVYTEDIVIADKSFEQHLQNFKFGSRG